MQKNNNKYQQLIEYLEKLDPCAIAFSGGLDSTFLIAAAQEALGDKMLAITIVSPYIPKWEIEEAKEITKQLKVKHLFIEVSIPIQIRNNPDNRCYLCKKEIFSMILKKCKELNIHNILDGTNADDLNDYRPGMKALKELNILSPLLELDFNKNDIRKYSKKLKLPSWNKPPYACLLSRIPFNTTIAEEELQRIEKAELYLIKSGFKAIRVRSHGTLARIEIDRKLRKKFLKEDFLDEVSKQFKKIGYTFVTFELEGYRIGSMNVGNARIQKSGVRIQ